MPWFVPASALSPNAEEILRELANSGSSESSGVAEILNTIAEDGDESATDEYLIVCAEEIINAAQAFIDRLRGQTNSPER